MFHKLIKLVQVDVGEYLRGKVADREASPLRIFRVKASDYFANNPHRGLVSDGLPEQSNEHGMINCVIELPNVALKRPTWPGVVLTHFARHLPQGVNPGVSSLAKSR